MLPLNFFLLHACNEASFVFPAVAERPQKTLKRNFGLDASCDCSLITVYRISEKRMVEKAEKEVVLHPCKGTKGFKLHNASSTLIIISSFNSLR
jgi:hypothetical protein